MRRRLAGCLPGEILRGHSGHDSRISELLEAEGFKHLLIYRDPRDVVVSQFFWWKRVPRNGYWPYRYFHGLSSDEERLSFLIMGWPDDMRDERFPSRVEYLDVGTRLSEFLPWLRDPNCLGVRFEELIGHRTRWDAYRRMAIFLFPQASPAFIDKALSRMSVTTDPGRSKTFRKGAVGEWHHHFSEEHARQFKRRAGQLLISLGYEED